MPRITFIDTRVVRDHLAGTPDETKFHAGLTYELPPTSCARWKLRGAAVDAPELPANAEAVIVRQEMADGARKLYAAGPWPAAVAITGELLRNPAPGMTVAATAVRFGVENGFALYTRISHEAATDVWYGALVDHEWTEPPTDDMLTAPGVGRPLGILTDETPPASMASPVEPAVAPPTRPSRPPKRR